MEEAGIWGRTSSCCTLPNHYFVLNCEKFPRLSEVYTKPYIRNRQWATVVRQYILTKCLQDATTQRFILINKLRKPSPGLHFTALREILITSPWAVYFWRFSWAESRRILGKEFYALYWKASNLSKIFVRNQYRDVMIEVIARSFRERSFHGEFQNFTWKRLMRYLFGILAT